MNEAALGTKLFLNGAQEGNNVVVRFLLYLLHALRVIAGGPNLLDSILWNDTLARPGFADKQFNLEPGIGFGGRRPYGSHFWQGIAFDHILFIPQMCYTSALDNPVV